VTDVIMRKSVLAGRAALVPVDDDGCALLAKLKDGRDVGVTVTQHRNPRHHRLYWAMLKFIRDHTDTFEGKDLKIISTAVKLATGLVDSFVNQNTGETVLVPKSIAFAAMDQMRFNQFFDAACITIANRWMPPGVTPEEVRRELLLMVDGPHAVGERAP
jgi:hypothetical protein